MKTIGVLALQGDYEAHRKALEEAGEARAIEVRTAAQLDACDGLIIPGGESSTLMKLLAEENLLEPIRRFGAQKPIYGTCAGAILLARDVSHPAQESLGLMDIDVERNAYGRQIDSHIARLAYDGGEMEAVFIRAPIIRRVGAEARVVATHRGDPVWVEQGRHMVTTFHPELAADRSVHRRFLAKVFAMLAAIVALGVAAQAQPAQYPKQTQLPNPYRLVENWPTLPADMNGGHWGELIRADIDPKGNIWVFHRCFNTEPAGAATCVGRPEPPILEFNPAGKLLASIGAKMFAFPHGFTVDARGNIWASDANASDTVLGKSAKDAKGVVRGHQVFRLSPAGKVLMTLGKEGVAGSGPDLFDQPSGIAVAPNGDIFVTDGHGKNDRVVKFSPQGRFIKTWGHHGAGPGEFDQPHDISIGGSLGHVFVADRSNSGVQVFDQDGNFIAAWKQFGRPSAVYVSKDDTLYVSDSQSNSTVNPGYPRGITVGSAKDGSIRAFIPDPDLAQADVNRISGASGIVADAQGSIYAADVGPHRLRKYVLK